MIKTIFGLYLLYLYLHSVYPTSSQVSQQAIFHIIPNSVYTPQWSSSFLINLTSNTLSNRMKCAQACLQYGTCQTATYYEQIQTCSLFNEKSAVGQISTGTNQASSVLAINNRDPSSKCFIYSHLQENVSFKKETNRQKIYNAEDVSYYAR